MMGESNVANVEGKILTVIKESNKSRGLSLEEICKTTGLCRNTVSKYVGILEAKEAVSIDIVGNVKLVSLNKFPQGKKRQGA